jgi:hypothetical protein
MVYVNWEGHYLEGPEHDFTDASGMTTIRAPGGIGGLEEVDITVSGKNILPFSNIVERPHTPSEISVASLDWTIDGIPGTPEPLDDVTLSAAIDVQGRYGYNQVRIRFSVAAEGGNFERLLPDVFVGISSGASPIANITWQPTEAGIWTVRVELDPDEEFIDTNRWNNAETEFLAVRGPPEWIDIPDAFVIDCTDGTGGRINLLNHLDDPDTFRSRLALEATFESGVGIDGSTLDLHIDDGGRLWLCPRDGLRSAIVRLVASDGIDSAEEYITINFTHDPVVLDIIVPGPFRLELGESITDQIELRNTGPWEPYVDPVLEQLTAFDEFNLGPANDFSFIPVRAGAYHVEVGIANGEMVGLADVPTATIVFIVVPTNQYPPLAFGWQDMHIVEGETARVRLQAIDEMGLPVIFSLEEDDGLAGEIDSSSGVLRLRPEVGDTGKHQVTVRLSDGTNSEDVVINVYVAEQPSASGLWLILAVLVAGAALTGYLLWHRRREQVAQEMWDDHDGPKS